MDRVILVLEDSPERVEWLRGCVGQYGRIVWARGVRSFLKLATLLRPRLGMVILDHDLGLTPVNRPQIWVPVGMYGNGGCNTDAGAPGGFGLTGLDAARQFNFVEVPVLVWSVNPGGAAAMQDALRDNGVIAVHISFLTTNFKQLKSTIKEICP